MTHPDNIHKTCAILLAGGQGTRMGAEIPKQFVQFQGKPVARFSFDVFLSLPEIDQIVVVCASDYRKYFEGIKTTKPILFAEPGLRRQDSVYNGLVEALPFCNFICIHDAARPFIDRKLVRRVLQAGRLHGAATAGMPIKFTVKECDNKDFVRSTPDRTRIWEIQTPQVIRVDWLTDGFFYAHQHHLTVTDDVSLVELLGKDVKIVEGSHYNLKLTVPSDFALAENFIAMLRK